ncbi:MAG: ZPR1 zinc finger domain-containing protein, partial [Sulfolobales archaeon]
MNDTLRYLGDEVIRCVNCGSPNFKVSLYVYRAPYIGNILIEHGICPQCNYKKTDVSMIDSDQPKTIKAVVKSPNDLNAVVVKSSTATIIIPELGVEVFPGVNAYGYLTTIEGILERVLEVIPQDCKERRECVEKVELIKNAMNGLIRFTLIIKDPSGRSAIIGDNLELVV